MKVPQKRKAKPTKEQARPTENREPIATGTSDNTVPRRDPATDKLVTALMLAGEALATPLRHTGPEHPHATPAPHGGPVLPDDFDWLLGIVGQIRARLAEDPRRADLLAHLRKAFGDGDLLRLLFRCLFPAPPAPPYRLPNGRPLLSPRQVEVLYAASKDPSHKEIARELRIKAGTVNNHLNNIYRRLNVNNPMQAVTRAISMGYLDLDAVNFVETVSRCHARNFSLFDTFISCQPALYREPRATALTPLVEFGLLLMTIGGTAAFLENEDRVYQSGAWDAIVCEFDARGDLVRSVGQDCLRGAKGITVAPAHAARHGFTPGNLFVVHGNYPQVRLNMAVIAEFTPDGRYIRSFWGSSEIDTRTVGAHGPVFSADGRLLVPSGGLTDAILAFSDGGRKVQQFADCCCVQVCVGPSSRIYAAQVSGIGCTIKVFDLDGRPLQTIGSTPAGVYYTGIAVNSRGHIFASRYEVQEDRGEIEEFDAHGEPLRTHAVRGCEGYLAVDAQDRLYVPCPQTRDVKVLSPPGTLLRRIDLRGKVAPGAVAVGNNGSLWVSGQAL